MAKDVRIGATGVAECISKGLSPRRSMLRPFKYNKSGEGAGRSAYYQYALNAIRQFHRSGNSRTVLRDARRSMDSLASDPSLSHLQRTKLLRNADAIATYQKIYGDRQFELLPRHRLQLKIAGVTITAQPDLWVREGTIEVIIKIGVHKKKQPELFMELMLHILRKAAIATGYKVRARNVAFLDITSGDERIAKLPLSYFNKKLASTCREIEQIWPDITQSSNQSGDAPRPSP
jgi:hypothetical protein